MRFEFQNSKGDLFQFENGIELVDVTGIGANGVITSSSLAGYDGGSFISSRMEIKDVILLVNISGIKEDGRERIYNNFLLFGESKLIYTFNDGRKIFLSCMPEKIDGGMAFESRNMQISLKALDPYFHDITPNSKIMSAIRPLWRFPHHFDGSFKFSERMQSVIENFINDSTVEVYPVVEFLAKTALTNPSVLNINTYEKAKVNYAMSAGDKIIIDTRKDEKTIMLYNQSGTVNLFNNRDTGFRFFKLHCGDNYLKYDADTNSGGLQVTVRWENCYGGI